VRHGEATVVDLLGVAVAAGHHGVEAVGLVEPQQGAGGTLQVDNYKIEWTSMAPGRGGCCDEDFSIFDEL
jgi:hypothetical protein